MNTSRPRQARVWVQTDDRGEFVPPVFTIPFVNRGPGSVFHDVARVGQVPPGFAGGGCARGMGEEGGRGGGRSVCERIDGEGINCEGNELQPVSPGGTPSRVARVVLSNNVSMCLYHQSSQVFSV